MKKIEAEIIADSISPQGNRIISYLLTYPRFIHSELMTHRMFSRNSASSRAIPFEKMVKMVEEDPFIPIAWQRDHKGMQGAEYIERQEAVQIRELQWLQARDSAIHTAKELNSDFVFDDGQPVTKQLCNRLLEPFMWHTVLVTATEWENFFELRCPLYQTPVSQTVEPQYSWKDLEEVHSNPINLEILENNRDNYTFKFQHSKSSAEIHIQALAEAMWDTMNESTPKELKSGDWHIPFGDKIDFVGNLVKTIDVNNTFWQDYDEQNRIKIATARCARLSYMTFDGEIDYKKDIKLHDTLLESQHMSPFEHCARAMSEEEYESFRKGKHEVTLMDNTENQYWFIEDDSGEKGWCNNFKGWISYRYMIENERLY